MVTRESGNAPSGAGKYAIVAAALLLALPLWMITYGSGGTRPPQQPPTDVPPAGGDLNAAAIPDQKLVKWIQAAGSVCEQVTAPLIAAQIEAESNWNPNAVSPAGALGIAQFLPTTFAAIGRDENHNGRRSPFDPPDAIGAQGRFMCQIAKLVNKIPGDTTSLILAGYNAGPNAVIEAGGVPKFIETINYIKRIKSLIPKYTADDGGTGPGGNCRQPLLITPVIGSRLGEVGSAWAWYGRHTGVDYIAPMGAKVVAACDGKISSIQSGGSYGNHVIQDLGQVDGHHYEILYAHMTAFSSVSAGQSVKAGTVIGYVGATGNAFGPHLHAEVRRDFDGPKPPFDHFEALPEFIKKHSDPPKQDHPDEGDPADTVAAVIKAAKSQIGVPYSFGGGTVGGPSDGGSGTVGFDCSSYVQYAWYQGTNGRVTLPRTTYDQVSSQKLKTVARKKIQPGDLIFFQTASQGGGWSHVGLYVGDGKMLEEPRTGKSAQLTDISTGYYANQKQLVRRVVVTAAVD